MTAIPLRLREPPPWHDPPVEHDGHQYVRRYAPGDCWYPTPDGAGGWTAFADGPGWAREPLTIAPEHAGTRPMIVVLPDGPGQGYAHCLHQPTRSKGQWGPRGWTVTGELPVVTVSPSIDCGKPFHGWVRDGRIEW